MRLPLVKRLAYSIGVGVLLGIVGIILDSFFETAPLMVTVFTAVGVIGTLVMTK